MSNRPSTAAAARRERAALSVPAPSATPRRAWSPLAARGATLLAALALAAWAPPALAAAAFVAARLAYVLYVARALRAEARRAPEADAAGAERRFASFRARADAVMFADALALGALCVATRGTLELLPRWLGLAAGATLVALGLGVKAWAAASLPAGTFYWRDFFVCEPRRSVSRSGPYRWLADPMYTVGYAHAYGFALACASAPGLAAAAFAQGAILVLARRVERPYLARRAEPPGGGSARG